MYSSVIAGTDGSPTARHAVLHAAAICRATEAPLHLVAVHRPPTAAGAASPEAAMWIGAAIEGSRDAVEATKTALEEEAEKLRADGVTVTTHVCEGEPADVLIDVADVTRSDLIVVGSKGMHGARRFIGSVPNRISHRAPVSVLIVRTD